MILADPPWAFKTYSRAGLGRSAEAHYDCMDLDQIEGLGVGDVAAQDCALFLWTTDPMLPAALRIIEAWGFTYKTVGFYWAKTNATGTSFPIGTGYYTRANPEQCLLATRGHPRRQSCGVRKLIVAPRREHSRKPDETHAGIEALFPGPYLELFARHARPGWAQWGNELETGPGARRWRSS